MFFVTLQQTGAGLPNPVDSVHMYFRFLATEPEVMSK